MAFSGIFYFVDSGPSVFKYLLGQGCKSWCHLIQCASFGKSFSFFLKSISCTSLRLSYLNRYFFHSLFIYPFIYSLGDCHCFSGILLYISFSVYFFLGSHVLQFLFLM